MRTSSMSNRSNDDFNNVQSPNKKAKIGSIPNDVEEVNGQEKDKHDEDRRGLLARTRTHTSGTTGTTTTTLSADWLNSSFGPSVSSVVLPSAATAALVKGESPEGKQESGDDAAASAAERRLLATSPHEKMVRFFTSNDAWCANSYGGPEEAKNWLKFPLKVRSIVISIFIGNFFEVFLC